MVVQAGAGELFEAVAAVRGQFTYSFLYCQIPATQALADLTAAVRARGLLFLQPCVCQQVDEAASTHQVPVCTLTQKHALIKKSVHSATNLFSSDT